MIEYINHKDKVFSIIIRRQFKKDGIEFFTPGEFSQQLAYMKRRAGYSIAPHIHKPAPREVRLTQEVLFIKSGKVRVDFFDDQEKYLESRVLNSGDVILLADGGHGLVMLEESEIIEVKQGPYLGEEDKRRFALVEENQIKVKE